ncbi:MAG: LCP family protein [Pseudonocardiales bacterium]|nr:LCP family protein [Pseudonocardiales bacterium]
MLSAVVLVVVGYGWVQLCAIGLGLNRADVIAAPPTPAAPSIAPTPAPGDVSAESATGSLSPWLAGDQNVLVVGVDSRTDARGEPLAASVLQGLHAGATDDGGQSTDTMIVMHLPAGGGTVTAISIPRDSYVPIAGGFGTHKINSAYAYGAHAAAAELGHHVMSGARLPAADAAGARTAIATVERLTGLRITHYAAVNLAGFYQLSQAIGGVPVCLNAPVHDSYTGADLPAGPQTLSGAEALAFVRQRHGLADGDLDRIRRQQRFLAGLGDRVLNGGMLTNPAALHRLLVAARSSITVDQDFDLLAAAQALIHLRAGDITFATIPIGTPNLHTRSDGDAVEVDTDQVHTFIRAVLRTGRDSDRTTEPAAAQSDRTATAPSANAPSCVN